MPFSCQVLGAVGRECGGNHKWPYWVLSKSNYSKLVRDYVAETFSEIYRLVKKIVFW